MTDLKEIIVLEATIALHLSFSRISRVCLSSELLRRLVFVSTLLHTHNSLLGKFSF